jgi:hypothetical protein
MAHRLRHLIRRVRGFALLPFLLVVLRPVVVAQPPPEVMIRFTVFSAEPVEGVLFASKPEAPKTPVIFYPTARSPHYAYQGANPVRFYRAPANDAAGGEMTVAEVVIPPGVQDALLVFLPDASANRPPYRVYLVDDGTARLARGWIGIVNFSGLPLSGTIAGKAVTLKDGLNPPLRIGRSAKVELRTPFKGRSYPAYVDGLELGPDERALLILFPPYRAGSLEVQSRLLVDAAGNATVRGR